MQLRGEVWNAYYVNKELEIELGLNLSQDKATAIEWFLNNLWYILDVNNNQETTIFMNLLNHFTNAINFSTCYCSQSVQCVSKDTHRWYWIIEVLKRSLQSKEDVVVRVKSINTFFELHSVNNFFIPHDGWFAKGADSLWPSDTLW